MDLVYQAPLSNGALPGKNTAVGCHFLLQRNLPHPGIELTSPALAGGFFTTESLGKPNMLGLFLLTSSMASYMEKVLNKCLKSSQRNQ